MRPRVLVVFIALSLTAPLALGAPKGGAKEDPYVLKAGDTMTGDLEMEGAVLKLEGRALASPGPGTLTFDGATVCLVTGNCPDADTTYTAGNGLALVGTTFSLLGCAGGEVLKVIAGVWACGTDVDTDTTYSAGGGLSLAGTTFALVPCGEGELLRVSAGAWACASLVDTDTLGALTCGEGELVKVSSGQWACSLDVDTDTTYAAGAGLALVGTTFSLAPCAEGDFLQAGASGAWSCAPDASEGGDADTLGGLTSAQFLRSDATTTFSGPQLVVQAGSLLDVLGSLRLGLDDAGNNDRILFDAFATQEWIEWHDSRARFEMTDDLALLGAIQAGNLGNPVTYSRLGSGTATLASVDSAGDLLVSDVLEVLGTTRLGQVLQIGGTAIHLNYDGPNANAFLCIHAADAVCGESLSWIDVANQFQLTDDLALLGALQAGTIAQSPGYNRLGAGTATLPAINSASDLLVSDALEVGGAARVVGTLEVLGNTVWINQDGSAGASTLCFGGPGPCDGRIFWNSNFGFISIPQQVLLGDELNLAGPLCFSGTNACPEALVWDAANERFRLSDDLRLNGELTTDGNVLRLNADGDASPTFACFVSTPSCSAFLQWSQTDDRFWLSDDLITSGKLLAVGDVHLADELCFTSTTACPESLRWDAANTRFVLSDDLRAVGDVWLDKNLCFISSTSCTEFIGWDAANSHFRITDDAFVTGKLTATGPIRSSSWVEAGSTVEVSGTQITLNIGGPDRDSSIYFYEDGSPTGERIFWDDSADRFVVSDGLEVQGGIVSSSTRAIKRDVTPIPDALATILRLHGVMYESVLSGEREIGLIAEEVAPVLPEVVAFAPDGAPSGIDYGRLVALLIEGMKEQQTRLDDLEARLAALEGRAAAT